MSGLFITTENGTFCIPKAIEAEGGEAVLSYVKLNEALIEKGLWPKVDESSLGAVPELEADSQESEDS